MRVIARECQREAHESAAPPSNCGECGNDYWLHATVFRLPPAVHVCSVILFAPQITEASFYAGGFDSCAAWNIRASRQVRHT